MDALDPEPGFDGMYTMSGAASPEGYFIGWTPGKFPFAGREGMAWRLDPGTDIIVQVHLRPLGEAATVRARVGLYFADEPPSPPDGGAAPVRERSSRKEEGICARVGHHPERVLAAQKRQREQEHREHDSGPPSCFAPA